MFSAKKKWDGHYPEVVAGESSSMLINIDGAETPKNTVSEAAPTVNE